MWDIVKYKLIVVASALAIELTMVVTRWATKLVLGWLDYDQARSEALSQSIGNWVGGGLGITLFIGFLISGRELVDERPILKEEPSPLPELRPPLPELPPIELPLASERRVPPRHDEV